MDSEKFAKLKKIIDKEVSFNEQNASEKVYLSSQYYQKYLDIYTNECLELEDLKLDMNKVYGERLHHYKYNHSYEWDSQAQLTAKIHSDQKYIDVAQKFNRQKIIVDYLEKTLKNISGMTYAIREFRELKLFFSGRNY